MKIKSFVLLLAFLVSFWKAEAQGFQFSPGDYKSTANTISTGLTEETVLSFQYSRIFANYKLGFLSAHIGIGSYLNSSGGISHQSIPTPWVIPNSLYATLGKGRNYVELGTVGSLLPSGFSERYQYGFSMGYRRHPLSRKKASFRFGFQLPLNANYNSNGLLYFWYLHLGLAF